MYRDGNGNRASTRYGKGVIPLGTARKACETATASVNGHMAVRQGKEVAELDFGRAKGKVKRVAA